MQYANVPCWACKKPNPNPSDGNFYLCSRECSAIYDAKAMQKELIDNPPMNRAERRAAKKAGKSFH